MEVLLKYRMGRRLILREMSLRIRLATRCVTVDMMKCCKKDSSVPAAKSATSVRPMRVTPGISMLVNIPSVIFFVSSETLSGPISVSTVPVIAKMTAAIMAGQYFRQKPSSFFQVPAKFFARSGACEPAGP